MIAIPFPLVAIGGGAVLIAGGLAVVVGLVVRRRRARGRRSWAARQIRDLEQEITELSGERRILTEERSRLIAESAARAARIEELEWGGAAARDIGEQARLAARSAEERIGELTRKLAEAEARLAEIDGPDSENRSRERELRRLTEQRETLAARLDEAARTRAERDAECTRLELQVESLSQQLRQAVASARGERTRLETNRALLSTQIVDLKRQLEAAREQVGVAGAERDQARVELARAQARLQERDGTHRIVEVSHQEELARLAAERGALEAQVERLEPLRNQVADREQLLRSLAQERDEALTLSLQTERALRVSTEKGETAAAEIRRLQTLLGQREKRLIELETRLLSVTRERDDRVASERATQARVDSLKAEIRERDLRFRALLADRRSIVESGQAEVARVREELTRLQMAGPVRAHGNGDSEHEPEPPLDDLQAITGIGPAIARALATQGIRTFKQIAVWTDADIDRLSTALGNLRARIRRDRWIEQAREQHERVHGERIVEG